MKIRPMTLDDLSKVAFLEQQIFADAWSFSSFEIEVTRNKYSHPIILEVKNQIVGYAVLWKIMDEFHVANIAIREEFRGKKLGEYLLSESLKMAKGCRFAWLEVREGNKPAIGLYEKFGFEIVQQRVGYYQDGETALVMRKKLKISAPIDSDR